jgi:YggT family protein
VFVVSNFLNALARVLDIVLTIYIILLVVRALLSWMRPDLLGPVTNFFYSATEPVLRPLRRRFGFLSTGSVDFTPLLVLLIIMFIRYFVVNSLYDAAMRLH